MKFSVLLAAVLGLALATTQAATFTVAVTDDSGPGSLRQAILDANVTPGDDTIVFTTKGTIVLSSPLPSISDNTTVTGPGANQLTVSGNNAAQIFICLQTCSEWPAGRAEGNSGLRTSGLPPLSHP